jgi:hypothetical protein
VHVHLEKPTGAVYMGTDDCSEPVRLVSGEASGLKFCCLV